MATVTRRPGKGLRGVDKKQDSLQDNRQGAYDPVANVDAADASRQTARERAQPGADVGGNPVPATYRRWTLVAGRTEAPAERTAKQNDGPSLTTTSACRAIKKEKRKS